MLRKPQATRLTCLTSRLKPSVRALVRPVCSNARVAGHQVSTVVAGGFKRRWWNIAAVLIDPLVVEPVDPAGGGRLDVLDGLPGLAAVDQFGLVQPDDGLGQRVIVRAADRPDGRLDASLGQALGEPDRGILRAPIAMVDNIIERQVRVQIACSMESKTMVAATRQPRIRRA